MVNPVNNESDFVLYTLASLIEPYRMPWFKMNSAGNLLLYCKKNENNVMSPNGSCMYL